MIRGSYVCQRVAERLHELEVALENWHLTYNFFSGVVKFIATIPLSPHVLSIRLALSVSLWTAGKKEKKALCIVEVYDIYI